MGYGHVQKTGLTEIGKSRVVYRDYYKLHPETDGELAAEKLEADLDQLGEESYALRVQTPTSASQQVGRALGYLNDYLGIVSLVALFLAGLGAAYLFREYLHRHLHEIAILMSIVATLASIALLKVLPLLVADFLPIGL